METTNTLLATNLIGQTVSWYGGRGKEGGTVMAVAYAGQFVLLVLTDTGLQQKSSTGVKVE